VHAVNVADGKPLWTFKTQSEIKSSPVVVADILLMGSYDGKLYGLDAASGKQLWAYGTENYETLSPDRVGDFRAHTASGGIRIDLPTLTSVYGVYEQQWRPNSIRMGRLSLSLLQRF